MLSGRVPRLMNMENRLKTWMLPYWTVCRPMIYWNASPGCPPVTGLSSTLYAIEGYTHKEIAAMLHIQEITSRSQFARARKALQEMVQSLIAQDNVSRNRT